MGDEKTNRLTRQRSRYVPVAAFVWLLLAGVLLLINNYEFSLNERQTRPRIELDAVETEDSDQIILNAAGQFIYGDVTGPMLADGATEEVYATREAGLEGSELAQMIFESDNSIIALTMTQERAVIEADEIEEEVFGEEGTAADEDEAITAMLGIFVLTLEEGANHDRVIDRVSTAINTYFPRTGLAPNLWLMRVDTSESTLLTIRPVNTGILLLWFVVAFALVEGVLGYVLHNSEDKLLRPIVRVIGVFLVVWSFFGHMPLWDFILNILFPASSQLFHPSSTVVGFASQHLELVIVSSFITVPLGLLIGIIVTREAFSDLLPLANSVVNSGQTVPTLAVVAIMAPIIGFGFWPAIIALILYGLLPVVRNTITGLDGVDRFIIDSAKGMGMTNEQILLQIEIPIASRIIMAGIRTSMVVNVGTATLGAFVGSGGLGVPITSGLSTTTYALVLLGALPAALLAILIDYVLGRVEFVMTPKGLQIEQ